MNQINSTEILQIIDELYIYNTAEKIMDWIELPIYIFLLIALFKINQVLKIYIKDNQKYL